MLIARIFNCLLVLVILYFLSISSFATNFHSSPKIRVVQPLRLAESVANREIYTTSSERVQFQCSANYPVQWIYSGFGAPEFHAKTFVEFQKKNNKELSKIYEAELEIFSTNEHHTGEYKCVNIELQDLSAHFYVYVPGRSIFVPTTGRNLLFSENDTSIRIPCASSQKNATVSLHKSFGGVLEDPIYRNDRYDPRVGFNLPIRKSEDPTGIYICAAKFDNLYRVIEYTVLPKDSVTRLNITNCGPNSCARNSYCYILDKKAICRCSEQFTGDPYTSGCSKSCKDNTECSVNSFCNITLKTCEDPCESYHCDLKVAECKPINHFPRCIKKSTGEVGKPCGMKRDCGMITGSECLIRKGIPTCICSIGFSGGESGIFGCSPQCRTDSDCPLSYACDYPTCVNTCYKFNPCGNTTSCKMIRHILSCQSIHLSAKRQPSSISHRCDNITCPKVTKCQLVKEKPTCVPTPSLTILQPTREEQPREHESRCPFKLCSGNSKPRKPLPSVTLTQEVLLLSQ